MKSPAARRTGAVALLVAGASVLTSCAAFSGDSAASSDGEPTVVAAFYPLQFVSERVAGDVATVTNLTRPGQEPHDLELSPAETGRVATADLVVYEKDLQASVDAAVGQAGGETLDVAAVAGLDPLDHDGHDHAGEDHEPGHGDTEGHDHGDLDPHFWQDPVRLGKVADAVADRLAEVDPDHADDFRANAEALVGELGTLDEDFRSGLASCERNTVVVSHDAFGYLSKYGLELEPIAGLSPDAEPTPADLGRLQQLIRSDGVTTVFGERLVSAKLSATLAGDMGVRTAVLDPIEGLTDETQDEDYLSLMRQNLAALKEANGCE